MAKNPTHHGRTKHVDVRLHFICGLVTSNEITLHHCHTDDQLANLYTNHWVLRNMKHWEGNLACARFNQGEMLKSDWRHGIISLCAEATSNGIRSRSCSYTSLLLERFQDSVLWVMYLICCVAVSGGHPCSWFLVLSAYPIGVDFSMEYGNFHVFKFSYVMNSMGQSCWFVCELF